MKKNLSVPILLIGFFLASPVLAAPSVIGVSGTVSSGGSVTVSGSGFGTHADYHTSVGGKLNWKWQNFETNLEYDGFNINSGDINSYWNRLTAGGRSGYWAQRHGNGNVQYLQTDHDPISTATLFASYWAYIPTNVTGGKTIRIAFSGWGDVDYWYNLADGNVASDTPSQFVDWGVLAFPKGQWKRIDMLLSGNMSSNNQKIWFVGDNSNNPIYSATHSGVQVRDTVQFCIGAGYDDPGYWGFDDVYVDFTQARVEVCNSSAWSARNQCEIQIPTAWSTNSVTLSVNQGSFTPGTQAYLYVVDSTGAVNASGYPVTIGGGGTDIIAPSAPSGLSVR